MIFLAGAAQLNLTGALMRFVPLTSRRTRRFLLLAYLRSLFLAGLLGVVLVLGVWRRCNA
jgi:hypothetical protein